MDCLICAFDFYSGILRSFTTSWGSLIVPNGVHSESLLRNIHTRHASQLLVAPAVHLDKSELVIAQCHPLVSEIAGAHSVGVTAASGCRVDEELALNLAVRAELEGSNVAGDVEVVRPSCGEQVLAALGAECNIATVFVAWGKT